jgi:hypothetical protein
MTKLVLLDKIKDNKHRSKKRNPMHLARVEQLKESIKTTGFWKGVYGREKEDGTVEIAFGHHRVDAARKLGLKEIPVEIANMSDSDMLLRMTRENLQGDLLVALEAAEAAVKALASGAVSFDAVDPSTRKDALRYAPSFTPENAPDTPGVSRPYTTDSLARFLGAVYVKPNGCAQNTVLAALGILEMEERKVPGFSERILRVVEQDGEDDRIVYLGAKKIIKIVSGIKKYEMVGKVKKRNKTQKELADYNAKQKALQKDIKDREDKEKAEHDELVRQQLEAKYEEDVEALRILGEKMRKQIADAKKKAAEDEATRKGLDAKVEETKKRAEEEAAKDMYAPIKHAMKTLIGKMEREGNGSAFAEEAKVLARKPLNTNDRELIRQAALRLGTWYTEWVATQFLPPLTSRSHTCVKKEKK